MNTRKDAFWKLKRNVDERFVGMIFANYVN